MTDQDRMQYQIQQIALLTIEKILNSPNVPTNEGKLQLISYVVGASTQTIPELEYNV